MLLSLVFICTKIFVSCSHILIEGPTTSRLDSPRPFPHEVPETSDSPLPATPPSLLLVRHLSLNKRSKVDETQGGNGPKGYVSQWSRTITLEFRYGRGGLGFR